MNTDLARVLNEVDMTPAELARRLNAQMHRLTGSPGSLTAREVRRWLKGQVAWPHERYRLCLRKVLGRTARELGFTPRSRAARAAAEREEADVRRRRFLATTSAATTVLATSGLARPPLAVGDVRELRASYQRVLTSEKTSGGHAEQRALALSDRILTVMRDRAAATPVRRSLHALAAGSACTAAFAAVDAGNPTRARNHLDRAVTLAGLGADSGVQYQTWNHLAVVAAQMGNHHEALDAAEAARRSTLARTDPRFISLAWLRDAHNHAHLGESIAAHTALHRAEAAYHRSDTTSRQPPAWARFFDEAELHGLIGVTLLRLGHPLSAEREFHQALGAVDSARTRNRAYYGAYLALAQTQQDELELACRTADRVLTLTQAVAGSQRTRDVLTHARNDMIARQTRTPAVRDWLERTTSWS